MLMGYRYVNPLRKQCCSGGFSPESPQCRVAVTIQRYEAPLRRSEEQIRNYFKEQRHRISGKVLARCAPPREAETSIRFPPPSDLDFQIWVPGLQRSQTMNSSPKYALESL